MKPGAHYLGDGLYVRDEGFQVCLFATDGLDILDEVYLDASVLQGFMKWLSRARHLKIEVTKLAPEEFA